MLREPDVSLFSLLLKGSRKCVMSLLVDCFMLGCSPRGVEGLLARWSNSPTKVLTKTYQNELNATVLTANREQTRLALAFRLQPGNNTTAILYTSARGEADAVSGSMAGTVGAPMGGEEREDQEQSQHERKPAPRRGCEKPAPSGRLLQSPGEWTADVLVNSMPPPPTQVPPPRPGAAAAAGPLQQSLQRAGNGPPGAGGGPLPPSPVVLMGLDRSFGAETLQWQPRPGVVLWCTHGKPLKVKSHSLDARVPFRVKYGKSRSTIEKNLEQLLAWVRRCDCCHSVGLLWSVEHCGLEGAAKDSAAGAAGGGLAGIVKAVELAVNECIASCEWLQDLRKLISSNGVLVLTAEDGEVHSIHPAAITDALARFGSRTKAQERKHGQGGVVTYWPLLKTPCLPFLVLNLWKREMEHATLDLPASEIVNALPKGIKRFLTCAYWKEDRASSKYIDNVLVAYQLLQDHHAAHAIFGARVHTQIYHQCVFPIITLATILLSHRDLAHAPPSSNIQPDHLHAKGLTQRVPAADFPAAHFPAADFNAPPPAPSTKPDDEQRALNAQAFGLRSAEDMRRILKKFRKVVQSIMNAHPDYLHLLEQERAHQVLDIKVNTSMNSALDKIHVSRKIVRELTKEAIHTLEGMLSAPLMKRSFYLPYPLHLWTTNSDGVPIWKGLCMPAGFYT